MPLECALSTRPPSAEDGGQAFISSICFCIYLRFRLQLHSAGVQALFGINVLHLMSKSHVSGVCNRLLADPRQWKRPRGVRSDPGKSGAQAHGWHRAFGSHGTFGCVATISRCATIGRCATKHSYVISNCLRLQSDLSRWVNCSIFWLGSKCFKLAFLSANPTFLLFPCDRRSVYRTCY